MKISRRKFIELLGAYGLLTSLWLVAKKPPTPKLVRPPGAVEEQEFLSACNKCHMCVDICPTGGLRSASMLDGLVNTGTPILTGYCIYCLKCTNICPTGALQKITVDELDMGTAVRDETRCLAFTQGGCLRCVPICPEDAIFTNQSKPYVNVEKCTGCGKCTDICPPKPAAIIVKSHGARRTKLPR